MAGSEGNDGASRRRRFVKGGGSDYVGLPSDCTRFSSSLPPEPDDDDDEDLKGNIVGTHDLLQHNDYSASASMKAKDTSDNSEHKGRADVEPELHHSKSIREPIQDPFTEDLNKVKPSEITPIVEGKTSDKDPVQKLFKLRPSFFTAKELNSCIIASERTRVFCSILIALLVVLSYVDVPLLGINIVNSKSIIAAKPLYMLLITDITIMVWYLVLVRRRRITLPDEEDMKGDEEVGGRSWARAVRILERGLAAHQSIRAIFIDCSLYVVIISCGLSLI